jgi:hypothetical protein
MIVRRYVCRAHLLCRRSHDTVAAGMGPRSLEPTVITDPTLVWTGRAVQLSHQGERRAPHLLLGRSGTKARAGSRHTL